MTAYRFIDTEKANYRVTRLCSALSVSRSAYYAWTADRRRCRGTGDAALLVGIRAIHARSRGTYGRPRVYAELLAAGHEVGQRRVGRVMREHGIQGVPRRRFRVTTDSDHSDAIAPNVLDRQFTTNAPNEAWVADITYVQVGSSWLYVAVVIDLFSRKVVGWDAAPHLRTDLCLSALRSAIATRQPEPGLLHHSDRGCQYASERYRGVLTEHGIECSMSRTANCWDNAVAESFFGKLKTELVHRRAFTSHADARDALGDYINGFYNAERRHRTLGQLSPVAFERLWHQANPGPAA